MISKYTKWSTYLLAAISTVAFLGAGFSKLSGAEQMVTMFEGFGYPSWFMYFIGACEVAGGIGLWLTMKPVGPWPLRRLAALGLAVLMIGALVTHALNPPLSAGIGALILLMITVYLIFKFGRLEAEKTLPTDSAT